MAELPLTQSKNDSAGPNVNPYAQRRTKSSLNQQTTQAACASTFLIDATNVEATSSNSRSPSTNKVPIPCSEMNNDYDDDAMIDEYMTYDNDRPPDEYDPYIDDDFENVVPSKQPITNQTSNIAHFKDHTTPPTSTETHLHRTVPVFREGGDSDEEMDAAELVRQLEPPVRRPQTNLSKFERFVDHSQWRREKMASPMRAKKWKPSNAATNCFRNDERTNRDSDHVSTSLQNCGRTNVPTTPDSMLLEFLNRRHYGTTVISKKHSVPPRRCSLPRNPMVGKTCVPMTLGDGTRVHIPVRSENDSSLQLDDLKQRQKVAMPNTSFGESMEILLNRVRVSRRKREYDKVVHESQLRLPVLDGVGLEHCTDKVAPSTSKSPTSVTHPSTIESSSQLWVDKHAPRMFAHLLSDERCNREVVRALREWDPYVFHREPPKRPEKSSYIKFKDGENKVKNPDKSMDAGKKQSNDVRPDESSRVILLSGPPGVGKTTLAHIVARHVGYRPIEVNGSDERTETALTDRVIRAMESSTLQFESMSSTRESNMCNLPNCLIVDEIDGVDATKAIQVLVEIIRAEIPARNSKKKQQHLRRPIIFICNNKFVPALKPLLPYAKQFDIYPPATTRLIARLRSILAAENMSMSAGGNSLLNQLVVSSCGDIRSCLFTLQFASKCAKRKRAVADEDNLRETHSASKDLSNSLQSALLGNGLKDVRSDIVGTVTAIFQKDKKLDTFLKSTPNRRGSTSSTEKIFDAVRSFGDNSRVLDCLFMNLQRVSYIDPSFDRCSAALEWMSSTDTYRSSKQLSSADGYYVEAMHTPAVAAATHILCRVEQPQDLVYSIRELTNSQYRMESNKMLVQKFLSGICLRSKTSQTSLCQVATDTVPQLLWILSAGEGSCTLSRSVTSTDLLNKMENEAFHHHAAILQSFELKYVLLTDESDQLYRSSPTLKVGLDPPIENLALFSGITSSRLNIPPALKQMLSRKAVVDNSVEKSFGEHLKHPVIKRKAVPAEVEGKSNFLLMGAKKAKALRSARSAARVGCMIKDNYDAMSIQLQNKSSSTERLSNTGSGMPLSQVVRLKYVKGFTQAVSMPCRLDDLL